jgi:hypothetical protein
MKGWSKRHAEDRDGGDRPDHESPEQDNRAKQGHKVPRGMRQSLVGPNIRIGSDAIKNWLLLQESVEHAPLGGLLR